MFFSCLFLRLEPNGYIRALPSTYVGQKTPLTKNFSRSQASVEVASCAAVRNSIVVVIVTSGAEQTSRRERLLNSDMYSGNDSGRTWRLFSHHKATRIFIPISRLYRVGHLLEELGWVDIDLGISPIQPISGKPKQIKGGQGINQSKPTQPRSQPKRAPCTNSLHSGVFKRARHILL